MACPSYTAGDVWVDVQGNVTFQVASRRLSGVAEGVWMSPRAVSRSVLRHPVGLPTVQGVSFNNAILTVSLDRGQAFR